MVRAFKAKDEENLSGGGMVKKGTGESEFCLRKKTEIGKMQV